MSLIAFLWGLGSHTCLKFKQATSCSDGKLPYWRTGSLTTSFNSSKIRWYPWTNDFISLSSAPDLLKKKKKKESKKQEDYLMWSLSIFPVLGFCGSTWGNSLFLLSAYSGGFMVCAESDLLHLGAHWGHWYHFSSAEDSGFRVCGREGLKLSKRLSFRCLCVQTYIIYLF